MYNMMYHITLHCTSLRTESKFVSEFSPRLVAKWWETSLPAEEDIRHTFFQFRDDVWSSDRFQCQQIHHSLPIEYHNITVSDYNYFNVLGVRFNKDDDDKCLDSLWEGLLVMLRGPLLLWAGLVPLPILTLCVTKQNKILAKGNSFTVLPLAILISFALKLWYKIPKWLRISNEYYLTPCLSFSSWVARFFVAS